MHLKEYISEVKNNISRDEAYTCVNVGWYGLIDKFYDELEKYNLNVIKKVIINEIKVKYGILRIYYGFNDTEYFRSTSIKPLNDIYEEIQTSSMKMCEYCGKEGKHVEKNNWIYVLCVEHEKT